LDVTIVSPLKEALNQILGTAVPTNPSEPVISGYIFDSAGSYRPAFLLCTIVSAVALATFVLLRKAQPRTSQHKEN
jgi:cyanate permease